MLVGVGIAGGNDYWMVGCGYILGKKTCRDGGDQPYRKVEQPTKNPHPAIFRWDVCP